jgi:flagellar biosynthesis/type III secretory pathway protein FliH
LSSNIIRDYNFIGKDDLPIVTHLGILAAGEFDEPDLPVFWEDKRDMQNLLNNRSGITVSDPELPNSRQKYDLASGQHKKAKTVIIPEKSPLDKLKEDYEHRLKKENQEAYLRGLAEGRNQGIAEWTPQSQRISGALEKAMAALSQRNESNLQALEKSIGDLAVFLAEKIIGEAISRIPDVIKENVDKCLKLLAGSGNVIIKINPADYEVIKAYLPSLMQRYEGKFNFHLEPAQNISPGGCFLELDGSLVDGRIETQLENIKQHIQILS